MRPTRQKIGWTYLFIFSAGIALSTGWNWLHEKYGYRRVQTLTSRDYKQIAELDRVDGPLDLNFRVILNNRTIFISGDFDSTTRIAYRECLQWSEDGKRLILDVGGHHLFGYDVEQGHALSEKDLVTTHVTPFPGTKLYEGKWPGLN